MIQWWYSTSGKPLGPVDVHGLAQLFKNGILSEQTSVWREGMSNWSPIAALPELKGIVMPLSAFTPQRISPSPAGNAPTYATETTKPQRSMFVRVIKWLIITVIVIILGLIAISFISGVIRGYHAAAERDTGRHQQNMTQQSTIASTQLWENSKTHRVTHIDAAWQVTVTKDNNLQFDIPSSHMRAVLSENAVNISPSQTFQESIEQYKQNITQSGQINFIGTGSFLHINGQDAWESDMSLNTLPNFTTHVQVLIYNNTLWQIFTTRPANQENLDSQLTDLRQGLWTTVF